MEGSGRIEAWRYWDSIEEMEREDYGSDRFLVKVLGQGSDGNRKCSYRRYHVNEGEIKWYETVYIYRYGID